MRHRVRRGPVAGDLAFVQPRLGERRGDQDHAIGFGQLGRRAKPGRKFLGDEVGRQRAAAEPIAGRDRREKRDIVLHAGDVKRVERRLQPVGRLPADRCPAAISLAIIGS